MLLGQLLLIITAAVAPRVESMVLQTGNENNHPEQALSLVLLMWEVSSHTSNFGNLDCKTLTTLPRRLLVFSLRDNSNKWDRSNTERQLCNKDPL